MSVENPLPPLIAALLQPQRYPHPVSRCQLIETHISWVILAGEFAYKIKKPLDLGFLDFSTLEKRRFYCEEEVRLNRRTAAGIYLGSVAIGGSVQAPQLEGGAAAIEYAVKMRRFPQQGQLDHMLAQGELEAAHIDAFARMAAGFHQRIAVAGAQSPYGEPAQVWQPMAENFTQIRAQTVAVGQASRLVQLEAWSREQCARLDTQLRARKQQGFVRECHGDMHLRNLAWVDGEALAFDGIEFNPALRWIDVMSEVAFMVMDLQARDEPRLAQRFLNAYLELSGDYEGVALLPFYLVYRALVRAKVAAIRSAQAGADAPERQEFERYLALAEGYTREGTPALLLARGMSASGKTTCTAPLLERLGAIRLRSDVERKRLYGMGAGEDGRAPPGEGIYSAEASERTYARLAALAEGVIEAGYTVIIDAVCQREAQRQRFIRLAREHAVPCLILAFTAPADELRRRIVRREKGASDADLAVLEQQLRSWEPLSAEEETLALEVDTCQVVSEEQLYRQVSVRLGESFTPTL